MGLQLPLCSGEKLLERVRVALTSAPLGLASQWQGRALAAPAAPCFPHLYCPVWRDRLGTPAVVLCGAWLGAELHPPTSSHLSWPGRFPQPLCQLFPSSVAAMGQAASRSLPGQGVRNVAISRVRCSRWGVHTQHFAFLLTKQTLVFHKVYDLNVYSIYL